MARFPTFNFTIAARWILHPPPKGKRLGGILVTGTIGLKKNSGIPAMRYRELVVMNRSATEIVEQARNYHELS
jgi:hypothetical protein